jgi:hypothetical protein
MHVKFREKTLAHPDASAYFFLEEKAAGNYTYFLFALERKLFFNVIELMCTFFEAMEYAFESKEEI